VLEIYLNSLAHVYDPHSDYLGAAQLKSFEISMKLSLFGIGAVLELSDGYCTIRELVPGSPAARSGALMPGDRIVGVAQAGKEPVDVVNMPLTRTVELIRGPKGTLVTLSVIPGSAPDAAQKPVKLVRDEIKLEDQQAKARIEDLPKAKGGPLRVGVIEFPSFYAEMERSRSGERRSVTADVARLLERLKKEKIQGLVLDLRFNGGGSLKEAIDLTGLFIKEGPVVQTRGPEGAVEVESDPDDGVAYDGPMLVLTSRFSASASEILAGALQDYGRALIVGDSQTFGKGTVQNVLPLAKLMQQNDLKYSYDPGALKITISKFYRPSGASTQLRGVAADIVVPSLSDFNDVSESALKNPLPWDTVPPARFEPSARVKPFVNALRERSAKRIAANKDFTALAEDVARIKQRMDTKSVSLNEAERREELNANRTRRQQREKQLSTLQGTEPTSYELTLKNVAAPQLTPYHAPKTPSGPANSESNDRPSVQNLAREIILNEGIQILADYTELSAGKKLAAAH
jgi:carboxyl-terminal processing protease